MEVSHVRSHKEPLAQASGRGLGYRVNPGRSNLAIDTGRSKSLCWRRYSISWLGVLCADALLPVRLLRLPSLRVSWRVFPRWHLWSSPPLLLPPPLAMTSRRESTMPNPPGLAPGGSFIELGPIV